MSQPLALMELCKRVCLRFNWWEKNQLYYTGLQGYSIQGCSQDLQLTHSDNWAGGSQWFLEDDDPLQHCSAPAVIQACANNPKIPFFHTDTHMKWLHRLACYSCPFRWLFRPNLLSAELPKALCSQVSFLFPPRSALCRTRQMETASTTQQSTS